MTMVVLKTKRLVLRAPEPCDADDIVETIVEPGVMRMMGSIPSPYGRAQADAFIARNRARPGSGPESLFAITRLDRFIGVVRVGQCDGSQFIAFWLARLHWGKGYMSEALSVMIAHFFASRDASAIYGDYFADNVASARVLEKFGFERIREGKVRSDYRNEDVLAIYTELTRDRFMELGFGSGEILVRKSNGSVDRVKCGIT